MPVYKYEVAPKGNNKTKKYKWMAKFSYKDYNGKSRQKKKEGFITQGEAKEFERNFLSKYKPSADMTFEVLVEHYLEFCTARLKETTVATKTHMINTKVLPFFKDMAIDSIEASTVEKWQNLIMSYDYKPTYLKVIHNQLSAIFNYAVRLYDLDKNPARICGSMGKKKADSMDFYTLDEFKHFMTFFDDRYVSKIMFTLLFWSGIREGEMLALTLNDFNFDQNTVEIIKTYARIKKKDIITPPKTKSSIRTIELPKFVLDLIKSYSKQLYDYKPDARLFTASKSHLNKEMKRGSEATGVKKIRVHDLRHSHASLLIHLNYSPIIIKERLGHHDIQVTLETYSHLYPNKHTDVAKALNKLGLDN